MDDSQKPVPVEASGSRTHLSAFSTLSLAHLLGCRIWNPQSAGLFFPGITILPVIDSPRTK